MVRGRLSCCMCFALDARRIAAVLPPRRRSSSRVQVAGGCRPHLQDAAHVTATSIQIHEDVAGVEPAGVEIETRVPQLHRWWWRLCGIALVLLIAVRWVRYVPVRWSPTVDHLLGGLMIWDTQLALWPLVLTVVFHGLFVKIALVVAGVAFVLSPRRFVRRT